MLKHNIIVQSFSWASKTYYIYNIKYTKLMYYDITYIIYAKMAHSCCQIYKGALLLVLKARKMQVDSGGIAPHPGAEIERNEDGGPSLRVKGEESSPLLALKWT